MTQPSLVLDAIAEAMETRLGKAIDVRLTDDLTEDLGETLTFRPPAVILSCTRLGDASGDYGSLLVSAQFVARCYARLPAGPRTPKESRGDVAMNLAAAVAQVVDDSPLWLDAQGVALATKRAAGITITNRTTQAIAQRGFAMWVVSWQQLIELTQADVGAALNAFKRLHVEFEMGTSETPDAALTMELEGREP
jgi:hypothetical protein